MQNNWSASKLQIYGMQLPHNAFWILCFCTILTKFSLSCTLLEISLVDRTSRADNIEDFWKIPDLAIHEGFFCFVLFLRDIWVICQSFFAYLWEMCKAKSQNSMLLYCNSLFHLFCQNYDIQYRVNMLQMGLYVYSNPFFTGFCSLVNAFSKKL